MAAVSKMMCAPKKIGLIARKYLALTIVKRLSYFDMPPGPEHRGLSSRLP